MRRFDPASQRTVKSRDEAEAGRLLLTPAREFLARLEAGNGTEGEKASEFWIPRLHPSPASLLDYLPRQALVAIDNRQALEDAITEVEEQAVLMRQDSIKEGTLPADFPLPYLTLSEIQDALSAHTTLELGPASAAQIDELPVGRGGQRAGGALFSRAALCRASETGDGVHR